MVVMPLFFIGSIGPAFASHGYKFVMVRDTASQSNGKDGVATFVEVTLPQELNNADNVNFHIQTGVSGGDTVAVGYLVCSDSTLAWCEEDPGGDEDHASWYWEHFDGLFDPTPTQTFGAPGSALEDGQDHVYKTYGDFIFSRWHFYQTATYLGAALGVSGITVNTSVLPTSAGMELALVDDETSVVGTYFLEALYYVTGGGSTLTEISQAKAVYDEGDECPPYKLQGSSQNSALEDGEIKVGNNQSINTSCPASGTFIWQ